MGIVMLKFNALLPQCCPSPTMTAGCGWAAFGYVIVRYWENVGAGDAIRTRDPNLGKVMLYP